MFTFNELEIAHQVVQAAMPPTPQRNWPLLDARLGAQVVIKNFISGVMLLR